MNGWIPLKCSSKRSMIQMVIYDKALFPCFLVKECLAKGNSDTHNSITGFYENLIIINTLKGILFTCLLFLKTSRT